MINISNLFCFFNLIRKDETLKFIERGNTEQEVSDKI